MKNGIDVSRWQGDIDWKSVRTDFCIIQAGYGREISQKDTCFDKNYAGCKAAGIPCGAYWYSYATSEDEARKEAAVCLEVLKGKQFEYPIYYDVEEQRILSLGKDKVSAIINAFCGELEKAGYFVGVYMSAYPLGNLTSKDVRSRYAVWVAHYGVIKPCYSGAYGIWQKSSNGTITGIAGNVDINEAYEDYSTIIKAAGLNGFSKPEPVPQVKPPEKTKKSVTLIIDDHTYTGLLEEQ